ncbi:3-oxoacyl-ACP synthase III family protein [Lysinibacter cavernae]|uniref:3-oxoacyl-[acyl-carrier-protein] synthase-3 n=1 Tax=Lysinibacter cavernae TaxID=1640652 RepID=A0A7X5R1Y0_9MICO|nr:ketoacyl-ACP synthase III [Lysinibacter cavernae]NIH54109.1 3-oxoacyl-[acyl-carrier-protein] synthase-3 [Lysinibacter cavernae]
MHARISAVSYYLPDSKLTNEKLSREFPEWSVDKISRKTGISSRSIAAADEFSSHLAVNAAKRLSEEHGISLDSVDYLILCTQSPDFFLPTTSAIVQAELGLKRNLGATDINLGCSGYAYALGLAKGLVESNQVNNVLVITADTYSKFINEKDKSVRTIFGDGASATFVVGDAKESHLNGMVYGTDGSGAKHLIVPNGGLRDGRDLAPASVPEARGLDASGHDLYMDGKEIFNFTLDRVPAVAEQILMKAQLTAEDIDLFVFHQANAFMLEHLRKKMDIPVEKFVIELSESGNTVSSTIPIALSRIASDGRLKPGMKVMLLGFGVGLSWGGLVLTWG